MARTPASLEPEAGEREREFGTVGLPLRRAAARAPEAGARGSPDGEQPSMVYDQDIYDAEVYD